MIKIGKDILTSCQERLAEYSSVQKENKCHLPAGSPDGTGGQFCSFNNDPNSIFGPNGVFGRYGISPQSKGGMILDTEFILRIHPDEILDKDLEYSDGMLYVLKTIESTAKDMGYPLNKIHIRPGSSHFEVDGKQYSAGGYAFTSRASDRKGDIDIYLDTMTQFTNWKDSNSVFNTQLAVAGLMKHEITHHRFQALLDAYDIQSMQLSREEEEGKNTVFWNMDDPANQEYLKKNYPLIPAFRKAYINKKTSRFEKEDGITPYSTDWWNAYKHGTATTLQAFHETLAEYAALHPDRRPARSVWTELYKLVEKTSKNPKVMDDYFNNRVIPKSNNP